METFLLKAVERFKFASEISLQKYKKPLIVEYSGGKDSDAILKVAEISGIPYSLHHSLTTMDAPPVVHHIKETFRKQSEKGIKTEIDDHANPDGSRLTIWNLIPEKLMPPTRIVRYCCSSLKETGNPNSMIATGVRWEESKKRSNRSAYEVLGATASKSIGVSDEKMLLSDNDDTRRFMENCQMKAKTVVNPIIDWKQNLLWDFLNDEKVDTCIMYQWGYERLGCIGCPMARKCQRERELHDFPKFKQAYIHAFDRMIEERNRRGKQCQWKSGEEVFHWWMEDPNIFGQMSFDDFPELMPDDDY